MNLIDITSNYEEIQKNFDRIRNCTIICCADHGVAAEDVSAYPKATTAQMVKNYLVSRGAAANAFANFANSELIVVDVGVDADISDLPNIVNRKIARGTQNITKGAAMTIEQAVKSIKIGMEIVKTASEAGYNCFLPGEMGIGNTTSSAAITSLMLKQPPEKVTGRGTNISDERYAHKIEIVKKAIAANKINFKDKDIDHKAVEILAKVGGFEIGCMTGIFIGAFNSNSLAIIDGFNSAVAALLACAIVPECRSNIIASHIAREKGQNLILEYLELQPMLKLDLALGEAVGSSIVARLLEKIANKYDYDDNYYDDDEDDEDDEDFEFDFDFDDDDDDEEYDVELNIYDGTSDQRFQMSAQDDEDFDIEFKYMSDENISVTDRTFNFYLNTMPRLDKYSMERCKNRIDNLSKPYESLGLLEEIAIQTAGISTEELPSKKLRANLICFTDKVDEVDDFKESYENDEMDVENSLSDIVDTAERFNVDMTIAVIKKDEDSTTVFDFGRMTAEDTSFKVPIIGISIVNNVERYEDIAEELGQVLLKEDGSLKYNAEEFLKFVPKSRRNLVSAVIGAIIAAAHNSSLVVLDSGAVDIIARYLEQLCPEIRPYILHATRLVVNDSEGEDDELDGEVACIGIEIVRSALFAANEMKTFKDTGVDVAIDGIGSIHQS